MGDRISVIIPNRNGGTTIGDCLEAALRSRYGDFEVIVVDDCSDDNSIGVVSGYPCRLIRLKEHGGVSRARNAGAMAADGDILFFTDADCLLTENALSLARETLAKGGRNVIAGGTYTEQPHDPGFFSLFQSIFINYSETKRADDPAYIAGHAMAMYADSFNADGGFDEDFLPILEDVDYSRRMREKGFRLIMNPDILVRHVFDFSLAASLRNAFRKAKYWTIYSMKNGDMTADSGAASFELKSTFLMTLTLLMLVAAGAAVSHPALLYSIPAVVAAWAVVVRKQIKVFFDTGGLVFTIKAMAYYATLFQAAAATGAFVGLVATLRDAGMEPAASLKAREERVG